MSQTVLNLGSGMLNHSPKLSNIGHKMHKSCPKMSNYSLRDNCTKSTNCVSSYPLKESPPLSLFDTWTVRAAKLSKELSTNHIFIKVIIPIRSHNTKKLEITVK